MYWDYIIIEYERNHQLATIPEFSSYMFNRYVLDNLEETKCDIEIIQ